MWKKRLKENSLSCRVLSQFNINVVKHTHTHIHTETQTHRPVSWLLCLGFICLRVLERLRKPTVLLVAVSKLNKAVTLCWAIVGNEDITSARRKPCTSEVKNKPWSHNTQCHKHKAASREHLVTLWSNLCWFDGGPLTTRLSCHSGKFIIMQTENCFHCHLWVLRKFPGKCKVYKESKSAVMKMCCLG